MQPYNSFLFEIHLEDTFGKNLILSDGKQLRELDEVNKRLFSLNHRDWAESIAIHVKKNWENLFSEPKIEIHQLITNAICFLTQKEVYSSKKANENVKSALFELVMRHLLRKSKTGIGKEVRKSLIRIIQDNKSIYGVFDYIRKELNKNMIGECNIRFLGISKEPEIKSSEPGRETTEINQHGHFVIKFLVYEMNEDFFNKKLDNTLKSLLAFLAHVMLKLSTLETLLYFCGRHKSLSGKPETRKFIKYIDINSHIIILVQNDKDFTYNNKYGIGSDFELKKPHDLVSKYFFDALKLSEYGCYLGASQDVYSVRTKQYETFFPLLKKDKTRLKKNSRRSGRTQTKNPDFYIHGDDTSFIITGFRYRTWKAINKMLKKGIPIKKIIGFLFRIRDEIITTFEHDILRVKVASILNKRLRHLYHMQKDNEEIRERLLKESGNGVNGLLKRRLIQKIGKLEKNTSNLTLRRRDKLKAYISILKKI